MIFNFFICVYWKKSFGTAFALVILGKIFFPLSPLKQNFAKQNFVLKNHQNILGKNKRKSNIPSNIKMIANTIEFTKNILMIFWQIIYFKFGIRKSKSFWKKTFALSDGVAREVGGCK